MVTLPRLSKSATALLILIVWLVSITNANPLHEPRAAVAATSLASSLSSNATTTGKGTTEPAAIATRGLTEEGTEEARIVTSSSPASSTLGKFCAQFVKYCYKLALEGQKGEVAVSHSCERNGDQHATSFTYSCARGNEVLTSRVLKALGKEFNTPLTETTHGTRVVTDVIEEVATAFETTTKLTTSTGATFTSTTWTEFLEIAVETVPSRTVTTTTAIPYTVSLGATTTLSELATATATVTTTQTKVFIDTGEIPVNQVVIPDAEIIQRRAPSTFCLAFKIACQNECSGPRVMSRRKSWVCDASKSPLYTLACVCRNGKRQTQHALEAVAEDRRIASVTVLGTSTTHLTTTRTTTLLREVFRTRLVTRTTLLDLTSTVSTTSTATLGQKTSYTGTSTAVETTTTTIVPTTTTRTTTATVRVSTTTQLVLAATGFVRAFESTSGDDMGRLGTRPPYYGSAYIVPSDSLDAFEFMAVRDTPTGIYKLAKVEDPISALVSDPFTEPIFRNGSDAYALLSYADAAVTCGAAGSAPGPITPGSAWQCEAFVFTPLALDSTPGATADTVNLRPFWVNPAGISPANHSGAWATWHTDLRVNSVADLEYFSRFRQVTAFTLRFPFAA